MSLTEAIKEYALDIGYAAVGVTTADPFPGHAANLARRPGYGFLLRSPGRFPDGAAPRTAWPKARSILALAYDYGARAFPESLVGLVGRIYQARAYAPPANRLHGARRKLLETFLAEHGVAIGQGFALPLRPAAARAGIVTFGRNTFAYTARAGSFVSLDAFVLDAELVPDAPTERCPCPPNCRACLDACPAGAITAPLVVNPERCLTFHACFVRGDGQGLPGAIPHDLREAMGTRVHGCDACQEACPRNRARLAAKLPEDPFLVRFAADFSLEWMLAMDEASFATTAQLLFFNYIREKKYLQRNAAVALGNRGDRAAVPALARALGDDPEPVVRGHAAWALGALGGDRAVAALSAARAAEPSAWVAGEVARALARAGQ